MGGEYLALARKYRPQSFADVVGQSHVVAAFNHALAANRIHHAYLLTGTRGIGKTTIARIFAKCLFCESSPGVTATPCGQCGACRDIASGSHPDVIEIDAASQTKVDDTRALLENTQYRPMRGRFKIYIIDEVHMLTQNSFNALLKTLEEPPEWVKFVLATTDPQKIPTTVISRCLKFQLRALSADDIAARIREIAAREGFAFEEPALGVIAHAARGSMRDALSLCDQALALGGGALTRDCVLDMLGTVGDEIKEQILEMLRPGSTLQIGEVLANVAAASPNFRTLLSDLAAAFHDLALYQFIGGSRLNLFTLPPDMLERWSRTFPPQDLQVYYQVALNGLEELSTSLDERTVFEMALLRLLAFTPEKKKLG
ncbi:MAG: DNA polymerase III subunit gamma/tau [Succinivibrionaceae bacterium]|nr:DNA polymerase III subunit gamma/tau [Succinivibrionaceae bacterium]